MKITSVGYLPSRGFQVKIQQRWFPPGGFHFGRIQAGILEEAHKDGLILLEDGVAHVEVALELDNLVEEVVGQVVHVGPLPGLVEELDEGEVAGAEQAGQAHPIPLHHLLLAHRLH